LANCSVVSPRSLSKHAAILALAGGYPPGRRERQNSACAATTQTPRQFCSQRHRSE